MAKEHLRVSLLDPEKLVKVNDLQEVSNPVIFSRGITPTPNGLLSNEIFGITREDRANTFAYIDLGDWFINPLYYKIWCKIDKKVKDCVHGLEYFSVNSKGELVEDPENGETGINFLRNNIKKIEFRRTDSHLRDMNVNFLEMNRNDPAVFIRKFIVIPAFYRDVDTSKGRVAVGELNELYRSIIISVNSIKGASEYGLNLNDSIRARIQELILSVYNYFGSGTTIGGQAAGGIIPGKTGALRSTVMSKTADYASRLVISSPELKAETLEEIDADLDHSVVPLASALTNFLPFVIFQVRSFFERSLGGDAVLERPNPETGKIEYYHPKDYQIEFSDERIKKEIDRFNTGYSNRFIRIEVPTEEGPTLSLGFVGYDISSEDMLNNPEGIGLSPIVQRDLTWCDVLYMCTLEAVEGRHVMVTRYPVDTYFNSIITKVRLSSTIKTEPLVVNGKKYPKYPYIRQEDIGTDTSNKFIDTFVMSNLHCPGMGADYDGDQVTCKGIYSDEANLEAEKFMNSKSALINLGGTGVKSSGNEAIQSLYSLTVTASKDEPLMTDTSDCF